VDANTNTAVKPLRTPNWDYRQILNQRAESVRRFPLFSDIPLDDCSQIVAPAHDRHFPRGKTIFYEGDPVQQIYLLTSGCVKISQFSPSGHEVILRLIGPGECFGVESSANNTHCSTARTMMRSTALVWEAKQFEAVADRFPALRRNVFHVLQRFLNQLEERYREISTQKVAPRLSSELLRLLRHVGTESEGHVEIALSRRDLAQLTGTTLFTVSRLLCQWEVLGIVRPRREAVLVLDVRALTDLSRIE
jgi:CRP/FNR family transcriptional regulator, nitrogen oxide reductase regulator